jgi:hypothetical protein
MAKTLDEEVVAFRSRPLDGLGVEFESANSNSIARIYGMELK